MLRLLLAAAATAPLLALPPSITESSGLVTSSRSDEVLLTHQDSGAEGDVHAVGTDGRLLATYRLGVQSRDWEDIARGPDERGRSSLWLGDIGDNSAARDHGILVHLVPEPEVDAGRERRVVDLPPRASYRLRYPDGPRDAETLLVHPTTGRLYVVTKGLVGEPRVYAAPQPLAPDAPNLLEHVADVEVQRTGTPGGPGIGTVANLLVTAGDVAPDGGRLALRTYTDLYEWHVRDGDVAAAVEGEPTVTPLPPTEQGEGLAYTRDGTALLTTSEGEGAPVHRVPSALAPTPPPRTPVDRLVDAVPGARGAREVPQALWLAALTAVVVLLAGAAARRARRRAGTHR